MANALSTLFKDIADAIRTKTGSTDTMKPAEFPSAIEGISISGEMTGTWISKSGSFTVQSEVQTVTHNLGVVPDIVIVTAAYLPVEMCLVASYGVSQRLIDSGVAKAPTSVFLGTGGGYIAPAPTYGMDNDNITTYGNIYKANATSFMVGSSATPLTVGANYEYTCLALT